jgi:hypothetical protein
MQVIRCGDMQSYYATLTKQRAALAKFKDDDPDPATTTIEEMALLHSVVEPPPLQVVLDYWLSKLVYHLKERN